MNTSRIELHSKGCTCRGGSWVLLEGAGGSPCAGADEEANEKVILTLDEWRQLGKPGNVESYEEAEQRQTVGERREFQRFEVSLEVRLSRIPTWREPDVQSEDTIADVIALGGALVRSRMAVEKGDIIQFSIGDDFESRAEVMYASTGQGPGLDGIQRLGLKFLDALLPDSFIPPDAEPLP